MKIPFETIVKDFENFWHVVQICLLLAFIAIVIACLWYSSIQDYNQARFGRAGRSDTDRFFRRGKDPTKPWVYLFFALAILFIPCCEQYHASFDKYRVWQEQ